MKRLHIFLLCAFLLSGCSSPSPSTPTSEVIQLSPTAQVITQPETNLPLYEAALETFFTEPEVRSLLQAEQTTQLVLYVEPEFNDQSGPIPSDVITVLENILGAQQIVVTTSEEASTAVFHMNSIQSDPNAERHFQFAGPTITLQLSVKDESTPGLTHTFGKGYMLRERDNGWVPEQYLIITN